MSATLKLKGWKAVVALIIIGSGWVLWRLNMESTFDTGAVETLKPWIRADFARKVLKDAGTTSVDTMSEAEAEAFTSRLLAAHNVELDVQTAHGSGERVVLKVEVMVDGKPPPDGKTIRYYSMRYSAITGWSYNRETDAVAYWLAVL